MHVINSDVAPTVFLFLRFTYFLFLAFFVADESAINQRVRAHYYMDA